MRRLLFLLPVALFVAIAVYFLLALNANRAQGWLGWPAADNRSR